MATHEYLPALFKEARKESLKLTKKQDIQVAKLYAELAEELAKEYLKRGTKGISKLVLLGKLKNIANELDDLITKNVELQANNIVNAHTKFLVATFKGYELNPKVYDACAKVSRDTVNYMLTGGLYKNRKGLSERIWTAIEHNDKSIQDILVQCRLAGMGSVDTANLLKLYVRGDVNKGAWKKALEKLGSGYASKINKNQIPYEALRLARTYTAHTATVATLQSCKLNPFTQKVKWVASNSDRKCSVCNDMDGQIFPIDKCPFDHPNGMCTQVPIVEQSPSEIGRIVGEWVNGGDNPAIDKWAKQMGFNDRSIIIPK